MAPLFRRAITVDFQPASCGPKFRARSDVLDGPLPPKQNNASMKLNDALGQSRRFDGTSTTSGLPQLADIFRGRHHVSKVPMTALCNPPQTIAMDCWTRRGSAEAAASLTQAALRSSVAARPTQAARRFRTLVLARANQNAPHP